MSEISGSACAKDYLMARIAEDFVVIAGAGVGDFLRGSGGYSFISGVAEDLVAIATAMSVLSYADQRH
ncbi:hypothetical protein [Trinickia sp. EG282A]|uniref:hypothetical protein n=1 Tax=Trinickia sp. EG282A TaxID=3237013 RepID=UPI0034D1F62D